MTFAAHEGGLKHEEVAALLWPDRAPKEWCRGCWMDSRIKHRLKKVREILEGYRDIAAGED